MVLRLCNSETIRDNSCETNISLAQGRLRVEELDDKIKLINEHGNYH